MGGKDDLSGRKIGEFVVRERIGEGGFGTVYCCDQPALRREAVIKILHRERLLSPSSVQRFLREAQFASRLDHPFAAHIYGFGIAEPDKLLWIAMERVRGVTLAEWLTTHGPMPLAQLVPFFERIAVVVQTAHECGIVHRDLKPSNVMVLERAGELLPKLLDFGVAKLLDGAAPLEGIPDIDYESLLETDEPPERRPVAAPGGRVTVTDPNAPPVDSSLTPKNHTVGSPAYISPEQWDHAVAFWPAADLYALAVMAFEALTGRRPFDGATMAEYGWLHRYAEIPALGGNFPPALDRMFQRALAKAPKERWGTAIELAAALRAASGIGATSADLPRIDQDVRDAWLAGAPQPLAESMAELDDARNAHQARDIAEGLARTLLRYLLAMTLAMYARAHEDQGDPVLLELVRALDRRELGVEERVRLLRLLVRQLKDASGAHPVPELLELLTPNPDGADGLDPILALYTVVGQAVTEDVVRLQLMRLIPELTRLLRKAAFVFDYVLVVPQGHAAERWTGRRSSQRAVANVTDGALVDGHPMLLDREGRVFADLWPLVQAVPPTEGAEPELFLYDGHGRHGALMIAAPSGLERHDAIARKWVATHVIAEVETKTRMREQLRIAAHQWHDRARPDALLWRGEVLADLERWTRHTSAANLSEIETSFCAASRRVARRTRWIRRLVVAVVIGGVLAAVEYHGVTQTRMAERIAELEQGRQALLHDEFAEAQRHLAEAYRRGDHSFGTTFMLARALQLRLAEQARFAATGGRMWSAAFSPDGQRVVTSDDHSARVWDARTSQLLFTLAHNDTVYDARYSSDGTRLVTASGDGSVRIWDAASGVRLHELRHDGESARYFAAAISSDGKLVAAIDARGAVAHVWKADTGAQLAELRNDASNFPTIAFSGDGHWLATSGGDDVRVFDTSTWAQVLTIPGPHIINFSFDPTGPHLATSSAKGDAAIWEIPSGARVWHLRENGEPVDAVAFSPNGELVATASRDGAEQIWNARSGALQHQFNPLRSKIISIEFDSTSKLVVAGGVSGVVVVADVSQGMPVAVLDGPGGAVMAAHFAPDSRRVVGASWDGTARVWAATSPYRIWSSSPVSDDCGFVTSLEPDQRFLAVGCLDHATRIWDTAHDRLLAELPSVTPVDGDFSSAFPAVSSAGDRAAIARGNAMEIYELPGGRLLRTIVHSAAVNAVAFAPAGHDVISGATDGSVLVTRDGREPIALPASSGGIDAAMLLSDGRAVVVDARDRLRICDPDRDIVLADLPVPTRMRLLRSSSNDRRLVVIPRYTGPAGLWDLEQYRPIAQLEGHAEGVYSARFVAGGQAIVTAGADGAVRIWDGQTGQLRQVYRGGTRFLADATVTPDGLMVVAGGGDGLLRFWEASSQRLLWTLPVHKSHVVGLHFEGNSIVTRGFEGDVSRWALPPSAPVIEAALPSRARGTRTLALSSSE